jgi:sugar lactone lactonase YvrE
VRQGRGRGRAAGGEQPGAAARFSFPEGVSLDSSLNILYVADRSNNRIRRVDALTGWTTTLAGNTATGLQDGFGSSASFLAPRGLAVSPSSIVYVADTGNSRIRSITSTGWVTTLAGGFTPTTTSGCGSISFNSPGSSTGCAVADGVGMRAPSLYVYFSSKNDVYDALFKDDVCKTFPDTLAKEKWLKQA